MDLEHLTRKMAEALIAHVPGATLDGDRRVALGLADLRAEVRVHRVFDTGIVQQHIWLTGGPLGSRWIEDNFAGFGDTPLEAVVSGVHNWVEGSFAAIRAAFGPGEPHLQLTVDGMVYDAFVSPLMSRGERGGKLAASLGAPLATLLAGDAEVLPVLHPTGPSLVSVFLARSGPSSSTTEVKIDGSDWPVGDAFGALRWPAGDGYGSVRELAVLIPRAARSGWPPAGAIRRTVAGLAASEGGQNLFGAGVHRFRLDPPLADAPARLPEDYAWFVAHVAASGAGPGYGLLAPDHPAQASLRAGTFTGDEPRGVVALAHHGCGTMTLLVCEGEHRGQVWVQTTDALSPAYDSFRAYYEGWLLGAVRRQPPARLNDPRTCAMPHALSNFLTAWEEKHPGEDVQRAFASLGDGAIATTSSGTAYFDTGDLIDLCAGCVELGSRLGLEPRHVVPGVPPKQGRP